MSRLTLIAAALLAGAAPVAAAPADDFAKLQSDYWAALLRTSPELATSVGMHDFDDRLSDPSLAAADRWAGEAAGFLARARAIPAAGLSEGDRVSKSILERQLGEAVEGNRFGQRTMNFTTYSSWHQSFADLWRSMSFERAADYENYLKRLAAYPAYNDAQIAVADEALKGGYVQPCAVLGQYADTITGVVPANAAKSRLYEPFAGARPDKIDAATWAQLQAKARAAIDGPVRAAYAREADWFRTRYFPKCAKAVGIGRQPGGASYYAYLARHYTTTELTPDQIHRIGLDEVARIRGEMDAVAKKAGFASRTAMIADMRSNPAYYAKSPEELMRAVARFTKTMDGFMPTLFGRLPRLPYTIREIPKETAEGTTTAYYSEGSPANGVAGTYYVNTSKLDQRPLYEIPALSMHESVPGHHNQIALQQEVEIPDWRRFATSFTAFVEGWGLYSERLGVQLGVYDTPQKDMARLSYEMWRACRLVVDTGIHSKGWTKEQAVAFMTDNSALSAGNIEAEVNRYISWPGQALGYKIGELKIRELRARAERALGDRFSLKAFHDVVLGNGAVPLDVLEARVDRWIAGQKARA